MAEEMLAMDKVKELYEKDGSRGDEVLKKFESLRALGEFGWRYLVKKKEAFDSFDTAHNQERYLRELTEGMIEKHGEYKKQIETCLHEGLSFGESLEQARERLAPLSPLEKEVVELSLKWTALGNIVLDLAKGEILADIAGNWHVSDKCVREVYSDFPEVMVSDYIGNDIYQMLSAEEMEHLKVCFLKVLTEAMSIQEYAFLAKDLKGRILKQIKSYEIKDFFELPKGQAGPALNIFLESGGKIDEKALVALANEKGINQEEFESLRILAAHIE